MNGSGKAGQRALYLIPLLIIPGLTWHYEAVEPRLKRVIMGLSLLWFVFLLGQWIVFSMRLFC